MDCEVRSMRDSCEGVKRGSEAEWKEAVLEEELRRERAAGAGWTGVAVGGAGGGVGGIH